MKKARRFNGEDGSEVEDEVIDTRTVKTGKLPSESTSREYKESDVSEPAKKKTVSRPKATPLSEPRVNGKTFTETIAKAKVPAPKETKAEMASVLLPSGLYVSS